MNWLVSIAEFVVNEILSVPAYLIGIIPVLLVLWVRAKVKEPERLMLPQVMTTLFLKKV